MKPVNQLRRYYYHVGLPILAIVIGTIVFFNEIMGTVHGNPHPQINYLIFALIGVGSIQMLLHVRRINREGAVIQRFFDVFGQDAKAAAVLKEVKATAPADVVDVLNFIAPLQGKRPTDLQHTAIESEIERFQALQSRELLLAQLMGGLMVGLGLLGTFIGLLGALSEIGKLIGSFSLGAGQTDPMAAINELVTRLTSPMQAMGVAFSASLFGVLGSLIMSILMVTVRRAASDLMSILQSRVALVLDISRAEDTEAVDAANAELAGALGALAEQSPMLRGLMVALDQSERRTREVVSSVSQMIGQMQSGNQQSTQIWKILEDNQAQQQRTVTILQAVATRIDMLAEQTTHTTNAQQGMANSLMQQREAIVEFTNSTRHEREAINAEITNLLRNQSQVWQSQLQSSTELQRGQLEHFKKLQNEQQTLWQVQSEQQQALAAQAHQQLADKAQSDRDFWAREIKALASTKDALQIVAEQQIGRASQVLLEHAEAVELRKRAWAEQENSRIAALASFTAVIADLHTATRADSQSRLEWIAQLRGTLQEWNARQEQVMHALMGVSNKESS